MNRKNPLVQTAYKNDVSIFCPAFSDLSAGFGVIMHQVGNKDETVSIDPVNDFRELTEIKMKAPMSDLFMMEEGVAKAQDTMFKQRAYAEVTSVPSLITSYTDWINRGKKELSKIFE